jgi:hypothetical protein
MIRVLCSIGLVALLLLVVVGCGGSKTKTVTETVTRTETVTTPSGTSTTDEDGDGTQPAVQQPVDVFLVRGELVTVVHRRVTGVDVAHQAMQALLAGPTGAERRAGVTTAIPTGTRLRDVSIADGTATVDLSARFQAGGGSLSMQLRVAEVVFTLTQFDSVKDVAFRIDGTDVEAIGGEGIVVDPPVDRTDFETQAPPILVEDPATGDEVTSPIRLQGSANVFEAALEADLRMPGAGVVDHARITASAGTGTRGDWDATLTTSRSGPATIVVYSRSAKDGSRINLVTIPVTVG